MRFKVAVSLATVACVVIAPVLTARPALAQQPVPSSRHHRVHKPRDYSGYLDPRSGHYDSEFQRNRENFGFSGRDPSRVGGEDPSLHPSSR